MSQVPDCELFFEIFADHARRTPDKLAFTLLHNGETVKESRSYAELERQALALAARLDGAGGRGERALLAYLPGMDFVAAFLGCLAAGVIAVPANPPLPRRRTRRSGGRLAAIAEDCEPRWILTHGVLRDRVRELRAMSPRLGAAEELVSDGLTLAATESRPRPKWAGDPLAFLQYTSGSTGRPKGVAVSHANLVHNQELLRRWFRNRPEGCCVSWLPHFHDMGLIGTLLQTLYVGMSCVLMTPAAFLQRPARWLEAVSRHRATVSGAPNFAYDLAVERTSEEVRSTLDLSSWKTAFNGAEPVRAATLDRFIDAFEPCGLDRRALLPGYGLAEATLFVSGAHGRRGPEVLEVDGEALEKGRAIPEPAGRRLVACGEIATGQRLVVVDPESCRPVPDSEVGEIWLSGPSVALGYWRRPEETRATFRAVLRGEEKSEEGEEEFFLRTGDLGWVRDGKLYLTGRRKDLIIVRGRNHYPQDIEQTVEDAHPSIRATCCAAFSLETGGEEQLGVVAGVETRRAPAAPDEVIAAIRRAVAEEHDLAVHEVALVEARAVPKTTSGKIRRRACRAGFLDGSLATLTRSRRGRPAAAGTGSGAAGTTAARVAELLAARLGCRPSQIDPRRPFAEHGLDSKDAVELTGELSEHLGRDLEPTLLYEHRTVETLARHLEGSGHEAAARGEPGAASFAAHRGSEREGVAIVGVGCRFPGDADCPEAFWELLIRGGDAVTEVPRERWDLGEIYDPDPEVPGKTYSRWGGFLRDVDGFDAELFGVAPREAMALDPQQRLLLEVSWEALERAGIPARGLGGSRTGVYFGVSSDDYGRLLLGAERRRRIDAYVGTGTAASLAAGRLSYLLGFSGPALVVDTACSSSLAAVHLACRGLVDGECDLALAGGVSLMLSPEMTIYLSKLGALSPTGRCRSFDAAGDGYVRAEGAAVVVLKRLADARADGDPVIAVIRGSAMNHDGHTNGLTAPSRRAQREVLRAALERAGLGAGDVDFVECHGTGTELGDSIEVEALASVLGHDRSRPLLLGAVKSNLGHAEAAAGVAGLVKAALSVERGRVPPNLHFENPNPHIAWDRLPFVVPTEVMTWPEREGPRRAGVSSFGLSGTNVHVILEAAETAPAAAGEAPARPAELVVLSARSAAALVGQAARLAAHLAEHPEVALGDLAWSLATTRSHLEHRLACVVASRRELAAALAAVARDDTPAGVLRGQVAAERGKVAFLLAGQGAQRLGMGKRLCELWPVFRAAFDRTVALVDDAASPPLRSVMWAEPGTPEAALLDRTEHTQPALFAFEVALAELWRSFGVAPELIAGHSIGELAAAAVAGVMSLEDAARLLGERVRLLRSLPGGAMAAIAAPEPELERALAAYGGRVVIAAVNGPRSVVVSGEEPAVRELVESYAGRGVRTRRLAVSHAFHSPRVEPMLAEFRRVAESVEFAAPAIEIASSVSGLSPDPRMPSAEYWVEQVRRPVRFADALAALGSAGAGAFVELGPKATLLAMVPEVLPDSAAPLVESAHPDREPAGVLLAALGELWIHGAELRWEGVFAGDGRRVPLPTYAFARERYRLDGAPRSEAEPPRNLLSPPAPKEEEPSAVRRAWAAEEEDARTALRDLVRGIVAGVAGFARPERVDLTRGFFDQGLDSLMAVRIRNRLQRELDLTLPATVAFDHPSVERLSAHLLSFLLDAPSRVERRQRRTATAEEPVAIVGAACRLPGGARDLESFWRLLCSGTEAVVDLPSDRWDVEGGYDPDPASPGPAYLVRGGGARGGFLDDIRGFDAEFFRISPREAAAMDPQQRLLLEVSWEALEAAGILPESWSGSAAGVFLGVGENEYGERLGSGGATDSGGYTATGSSVSLTAGRLSFFLGARGPSLAVNTSCSSSLVALHLACQALRSGECDQALAGGVNVLASPRSFAAMAEIRALSPDGRSKTFSAAADGYGRGEGCGVVVLKRLTEARRDGDRILALVRGTAVNHDGSASGLTVPSGPAQQEVLRDALERSGLAGREVDFVECHGTGTALGDPIEIGALSAVYSEGRPAEHPLGLGAVKAVLGHLEAAAGIAGLLKAALALERGVQPPQPPFDELNPEVDWDTAGVEVCRELRTWPRLGRPRRAGVSSFGMSGTNAHAVLEQAPEAPPAPPSPSRSAETVLISAGSAAALEAQAAKLAAHLEARPDLALGDLAYSLLTTRTRFRYRLAVTASSTETLAAGLAAVARGETAAVGKTVAVGETVTGKEPVTGGGTVTSEEAVAGEEPVVGGASAPGVARGRAPRDDALPTVVFVFPGQGSQWPGMGRGLLEEEPVFRDTIAACDAAIRAEAGWSLQAELRAEETSSRLSEIDVVQPALFALELALAALWRSWGVAPAVVVGHSMGEVAAACFAGALRLEDAVRVICRRSRLLSRLRGRGAMAVVELAWPAAEEALEGRRDRLSVAVSNSPRSTVISGDPEALDELLAELEGRRVFCRRIKVDVASHSPQVDPLEEPLRAALAGLEPRPAELSMRSTVSGAEIDGKTLDAGYWWSNLRRPVRFERVVRELVGEAAREAPILFVEISPHPVLLPAVQETLLSTGADGGAVGSLRRGREERATLLESLGVLWTRGQRVDVDGLFPAGGRRVELPTYAFERRPYWLDPVPHARREPDPRATREGHPLLGSGGSVSTRPHERVWERALRLEELPWLGDHRLQGAAVLPGAAYLEMALAAGNEVLDAPPEVRGVEIRRALVLPPEGVDVQFLAVREGPDGWRFRVASRTGDTWVEHARGHLVRPGDLGAAPTSGTAPDEVADRDALYAELESAGMEYGPAFRGLTELRRGSGTAEGSIRLPPAAGSAAPYALHPALLDACFHALSGLGEIGGTPWVPVEVGSLRLASSRAPAGQETRCRVREVKCDRPDRKIADLVLADAEGAPLAVLEGVVLERLAPSAGQREEDHWFLALDWEPAEVPEVRAEAGRWLLIGDGDGLAEPLAARLEAAGHEVVGKVAEASSSGLAAALTEAWPEVPPTAVVHLGSLDAPTPEATAERAWHSVVVLVRSIAARESRDAPRLWLVTRGAEAGAAGAAGASEAIDERGLWQSPMLGLGRTIALEHPELRAVRVDLDPRRPPEEVAALTAELLADDAEEEVVLRAAGRRVARLVRRAPEDGPGERLEAAGGRPFRWEIDRPGVLDRLVLRRCERRAPGPGEVEIAVEAAAFNFVDVLKALGRLPEMGEAPPELGGECAGRVVALGSGVEPLTPGEPVLALARHTFGTHAVADARLVAPIPKGLRAEPAAALPIAYLTAWAALVHSARLRAGERVLIHSASGGTGWAAVEVARHLGAEVLATAGREEKRVWLRERGIATVLDSRSLAFADEVLRATSGEGVDVVLNSLSGDAIEAGFSCLAADGRFVEIGKSDIYSDRLLALAPFQRALSYSAVDLAGLSERRPERVAVLLGEVLEQLERGALDPLPFETFPIVDAPAAFHKMAQARHVGKLVLTLDAPFVEIRVPAEKAPIRPEATYLLTGGLGGLGRSVARWLVERGARHLLLLGRGGPRTEEQRSCLAALEASGAAVRTAAVDVADRPALARVLREIPPERPLRGVLHLAGVLDDGLLLQQSRERFERVMAPKVSGAWNLHQLTRSSPLDFFVLYSSSAGLMGSPGQGNYAAANAFLDALAEHRRARGLPALSIAWGAFAETGLAAADDVRGARLARRGLRGLTPGEGVRILERLLGGETARTGVVPVDLRQWVEFYPVAASQRTLTHLLADGGAPRRAGDEVLLGELRAAGGRQRVALIERFLKEQVSQVLRVGVERVERDVAFREMGVDSLMGLELRNRIEAALALTVPATVLFTYPTVASLGKHLLHDETPGEVEEPAGAPAPEAQAPEPSLMEEDEVLALLEDSLLRAGQGRPG